MNDQYINELISTLERTRVYTGDSEGMGYGEGIQTLVDCFTRHKRAGAQIFFIGNGGSSAIASHMTADFMKNGGMKTYSLYDNAVTTCMGNDYGYEHIFSRPLEFLVREGDLLVAVSSSGNSRNILNAIRVTREKKASVITFTGFRADNRARQLGDINIHVPCEKYGIVESIHNLMLQEVVDVIMERDGVRF
ncbi:MAG: SIS domain-containing protein [Lachnospiraceae bacterium]|nr:SIS domain-containing protein [Lachnospiraceae bacterium]